MRQFLPVRHTQQRVIPELAAGKIGRNHAPVFAQNIFWSAAGERGYSKHTPERFLCHWAAF